MKRFLFATASGVLLGAISLCDCGNRQPECTGGNTFFLNTGPFQLDGTHSSGPHCLAAVNVVCTTPDTYRHTWQASMCGDDLTAGCGWDFYGCHSIAPQPVNGPAVVAGEMEIDSPYESFSCELTIQCGNGTTADVTVSFDGCSTVTPLQATVCDDVIDTDASVDAAVDAPADTNIDSNDAATSDAADAADGD